MPRVPEKNIVWNCGIHGSTTSWCGCVVIDEDEMEGMTGNDLFGTSYIKSEPSLEFYLSEPDVLVDPSLARKFMEVLRVRASRKVPSGHPVRPWSKHRGGEPRVLRRVGSERAW